MPSVDAPVEDKTVELTHRQVNAAYQSLQFVGQSDKFTYRIGYAASRNRSILKPVAEAIGEAQEQIVKDFVLHKDGKPVMDDTKRDYVYLGSDGKEKFDAATDKLMDEVISFEPYTVKRSELESLAKKLEETEDKKGLPLFWLDAVHDWMFTDD